MLCDSDAQEALKKNIPIKWRFCKQCFHIDKHESFIILRVEHDQMCRFDTIVIILAWLCVQKQKESYQGIDFD